MTPRPPIPPLTPPGSLFGPHPEPGPSGPVSKGGSGPVAARDALRAPRADARPGRTVEGAGDVSTTASPAAPPPLGAPPLGAPHREAWRHLHAHGPYTLQRPAPGWFCWLPEDPARPALGIASAVMAALVAHGAAAIDETGRARAQQPAKDSP